jgi:hypothetical protein
MKLFGRDKNNLESVPSEVQDYYRSERRERTGLAWLLALGTLVVTLIIAAGLFFGGRWAYRKVTHTDRRPSVATQQQQGAQHDGHASSTNTDQGNNQNQGQSSGTQSQPNPTPTPAPSTSQPSTTPAPAATPPATAPSTNGALVNTGPGDTVAVFALMAVAGTLAHHLVWVRYRRQQ